MKSEETTNNKMWKCAHCIKEFRYESEKTRHEQSHVPQFQCKVCTKKFSFLSALRRHEKQHERTGSVQCTKCGGHFRDETLLKRHMLYAHKGTHTCPKCDTTFNSEPALRTHMKTHKSESERRYHCSFKDCGKTFNFPHHLKHHELTHTDSKQYYCKECGKGFIQLHHLKLHQKNHEPHLWLNCAVPACNKTFTNDYAMKRHMAAIHKSKVDSRRSSDSGIELDVALPKKNLNGTVLCTSCGQLITRCSYEYHALKCFQQEGNNPIDNTSTLDNKVKQIYETDGEESEEHDNISTVNEKDIKTANCTSLLGVCIVSGDEINDKCICAQITTSADDYYEVPITSNDNKANVLKLTDDIKLMDCRKEPDMKYACESCESRQKCSMTFRDEMPSLKYSTNGIVKIAETFDTDIAYSIKNDDYEIVNVKTETKEFKYVPFNSCKDVLGNCIVSGNGTIGEGCFCAKMVMDDQPMIAQEIEDITPCPKNMN